MNRKSAKMQVQKLPTRSSRRSAGITEFLSLDLYSNRSKGVKIFTANENHNGVKLGRRRLAPKRGRAQSTFATPSKTPAKRQKRDESSELTEESHSQSSVVSVAPPPVLRKRGRPVISGNKNATAKQPVGRKAPVKPKFKVVRNVTRGRSQSAQRKKVPTTPAKKVKQEVPSDDDEDDGNVVAVEVAARGDPPSTVGYTTDEDMKDMDVKPDVKVPRPGPSHKTAAKKQSSLRAAIDETVAQNNPQLIAAKKSEVATLLDRLVDSASTMTSVSFDAVVSNLKMADQNIEAGEHASNLKALQAKVTSFEQQMVDWTTERANWTREKNKLDRMLAERQEQLGQATELTELQQAEMGRMQQQILLLRADQNIEAGEHASNLKALQAKVTSFEQQMVDWTTERDEKDRKLEESHALLAQATHLTEQQESEIRRLRLQQVQRNLAEVGQQLDFNAAAAVANEFSSSSSTSRDDQPGPSARNRLMIPPAANPHYEQYDLSALPRGSAVGHTTMAGRAGELITGLANVAGCEDTMASVAVTAATIPEIDEQGNMIQRTVRTRVERIAVTDDMNIDDLRALGFHVIPMDDGSEEDDLSERNGPPARIEEVGGAEYEDEESGDDEGMVEEAE